MDEPVHRTWSVPPELGRVVESRLDDVVDPCSTASVMSMSVIELGLIRDVTFADDHVLKVHLRLTSPSCMMVGYIAREVGERLSDLPGVTRVELLPDGGLDWDPSMIDPAVAAERANRLSLLQIGGPSAGS